MSKGLQQPRQQRLCRRADEADPQYALLTGEALLDGETELFGVEQGASSLGERGYSGSRQFDPAILP